uniref:Uncharacterized protein n=1 Tax=Sphaerodactylus townsendi TaxID=933632 RepID=A0ACB8F320_9SAUR
MLQKSQHYDLCHLKVGSMSLPPVVIYPCLLRAICFYVPKVTLGFPPARKPNVYNSKKLQASKNSKSATKCCMSFDIAGYVGCLAQIQCARRSCPAWFPKI